VPASAQQVIVHRIDTAFEDNTASDDDPAAGSVAWKGGAIHVVAGDFGVHGAWNGTAYEPATLRIKPSAIVKFAEECTLDGKGVIVTCEAPLGGFTELSVSNDSVLQIDGATLTDIRDDTVGGDTDKVIPAASPSLSFGTYGIRFGGGASESLTHSTIKYATILGHFGSMPITDNTFTACGGLGSKWGTNMFPPFEGAVTNISRNTFELDSNSYGPGALDVRGTSSVIDQNVFTGKGTAVIIGPQWDDLNYPKEVIAQPGTTVVTNNSISTTNGIVTDPTNTSSHVDNILELTTFKAVITGNTLNAPPQGAGVGLGLALASQTIAELNVVNGYTSPLVLNHGGTRMFAEDSSLARIGLEVHGNRFTFPSNVSGPVVIETVWSRGARVDAENNFWGDPTGPYDNSNADGLINLRGRGLTITNGIDYDPFLGGVEAPPPPDSIHIQASTDPTAPLRPTENVAFSVSADTYNLVSAATGKIVVLLRDSSGAILNQPGAELDVTSASHAASVPTIHLEIPKGTDAVTVEAVLQPTGSADSVRSNVVPFAVTLPKSKVKNVCIWDAAFSEPCTPISLVRGTHIRAKLLFQYTIGTGNGHIAIDIKERVVGTGVVLQDHPTVTLTVPAGTNAAAEQLVEFDIPLRDVALASKQKTEIYAAFVATNDQAEEIARGFRTLPILEAGNSVGFYGGFAVPLDPSGRRRGERGYLLVGEDATFFVAPEWRISTPGVTDWQIFIDPAEALDAYGAELLEYPGQHGPWLQNLTTGPLNSTTSIPFLTLKPQPVLPAGTRTLRVHMRLVDPTGGVGGSPMNVAVASTDIEVREAARVALIDVPAGASEAAFDSVPVTLTFASNTTAGSAGAAEFAEPFDVTAAMTGMNALQALATSDLIPINRYWSVYDTLTDGTFSATVTFEYDPSVDFPAVPEFKQSSLVVAGLNPLSHALEVLPSTLNTSAHTVTTDYDPFFDTYVVVSNTAAPAATCGDPGGDGQISASDALVALRSSLGSSACELCVCDVNQSGGITASDALQILRVAVGLAEAPTCAACVE